MKINSIVLEVLKEHWQDDVEMVGEEMVEEIIAGGTIFEGVGAGEQLPFSTIMVDLAAAAAFTKSIVELILIMRRAKDAQPTVEEVAKAADDQQIQLAKASDDLKRQVIESVIDALKQHEK